MSVLPTAGRALLNLGRYTATAGRLSRAAESGARLAGAARATRAARVAAAESTILERFAEAGVRSSAGRAVLPRRLLDATARLTQAQRAEAASSLRTLLELRSIDPRLVRSATFGTRFPGFRDQAKLLEWLTSAEGREAIRRIPEARAVRALEANYATADRARGVMRGRETARARFIQEEAGREALSNSEGYLASSRARQTMRGREGARRAVLQEEALGDRALAEGTRQQQALRGTTPGLGGPDFQAAAALEAGVQGIIPTGNTIARAIQDAQRGGGLPLRSLLRELSRNGDEGAKAFLRSAGKIKEAVPVPGQPGVYRIRSKSGHAFDLDLRSEAVRNTNTGQALFGRIERELGNAGLTLEQVATQAAESGLAIDAGSNPLASFLRRVRHEPGFGSKALVGGAAAFDLAYFFGQPLAEGAGEALGIVDPYDAEAEAREQSQNVARILRQRRLQQTFVANEARLAAVAPDLYNEALAGRRLAPGSRVYGAPQRTDDLQAMLEMMSLGRAQQAFGL